MPLLECPVCHQKPAYAGSRGREAVYSYRLTVW